MNTDNANKYLDERQIYQRDVWDSKDIEHHLDCLLEDYHQEQLKLLGIADVNNRRELLLAFYQHLLNNDPFPIHSSAKHREVDRFLKANNCG